MAVSERAADLRAAALAELRSGKYRHSLGLWCEGEARCAQGVFIQVLIDRGMAPDWSSGALGIPEYLQAMDYFEISYSTWLNIATVSDEGFSLVRIADELEQAWSSGDPDSAFVNSFPEVKR